MRFVLCLRRLHSLGISCIELRTTQTLVAQILTATRLLVCTWRWILALYVFLDDERVTLLSLGCRTKYTLNISVNFRLTFSCQYSYDISVFEWIWCLDGVCSQAFRNVIGTEHTASAVFVVFWLALPFRERRILYYGLVKNILKLHQVFLRISTYVIIFLFKISASMFL